MKRRGGWGKSRPLKIMVNPDAGCVPTAPSLCCVRGANIGGLEYQATNKTSFAAYYGGAYFQRNFFVDTTSTATIRPFIGFGGPGSPNTANRSIQEGTLDWLQTFFKSSQYGAMQIITQYSYVTRNAWVVPANTPRNARTGMVFAALRYVLP